MILERAQVQAAVDRALQLDPERDLEAAVAGAAQALCLPPEAVKEALSPDDEAIATIAGYQPDPRAAWPFPPRKDSA